MEAGEKYVTCVCTANVCRSPMAERLLAHALKAEGEPLSSLKVISAGVSAWDGDPASDYSVKVLGKVGINLVNHRSRRMTYEIMEKSILVIGMTNMHIQMLQQMFPDSDTPVILMRELINGADTSEVPDPFGADLLTYEETRDAIVEGIPSVVARIKELMDAG